MGAGVCEREELAANYAVADSMPKKMCESLSTFKGKEIVSIQARVVAATRIRRSTAASPERSRQRSRSRSTCPIAGTAAST